MSVFTNMGFDDVWDMRVDEFFSYMSLDIIMAREESERLKSISHGK